MKLYKSSISAITVAVLSNAAINVASAAPFAIEARSMGMANVSVATANIATAAFSNPAMLANQRERDDFAFIIGAGGFLNDDDKVIDDIDDFQSAKNRYDAAISAADVPGQMQALTDMTNIANGAAGKVIAPELAGAIALGFSGETYSFALSARSDLILAGTLDASTLDISTPGLNDPTKNLLRFAGLQATEVGFSMARNFEVIGRKLSIGIKPKIVQFDAVFLEESIVTIDDGLSDLTDDDVKIELDDVTTMDLGLSMDLSDNVRLGLSVKNLITDEFQVGASKFKLDTEYRAGVAYHTDFMTLGVDIDLKENDLLIANAGFDDLKTQYAAVGAEFNAFDFAQLRVGASKNIASGIPDGAKDATYYAGVGFWFGFNLDVAVAFRGESLGAYLQTGFSF